MIYTLSKQINYSLAGKYADYVHAHFVIESAEVMLIFGDGEEALGLGQMHPTFFTENYGQSTRHIFLASIGDTWPDAWVKAAGNFYHVNLHLYGEPLDLVVQMYNLGFSAVKIEGKRNPDYLNKWTEALNNIHGEKPNDGTTK